MSDVGLKHFDEWSKKALQVAGLEAHVLSHSAIGTEHVLLGLLRSQDVLLSWVLDQMSMDDDQRLAAIMSVYRSFVSGETNDEELRLLSSKGSGPIELGTPNPQLTLQTRQVCVLANEESRWLNQQEIVPVCLLLGLARYAKGGTADVLKEFGLSLEAIRHEVSSYRAGE